MAPTAFTWRSFYDRIKDVDPDLRQMALFDLQQELQKDSFQLGNDEDQCTAKIVQCFSAEESNSEVHSNAVRLLSLFVPKASKRSRDTLFTQLAKNMYEKPADATGEKLRAIRDNASLALKSSILVLTDKQSDSAATIANGMIAGLKSDDVKVRTEIFDVLGELAKTFGASVPTTHDAILTVAMQDVHSANTMLRKRATACIACIAAVCDGPLFEKVMTFTVNGLEQQKGSNQRRFVQLVSAISRGAGGRFAPWVDKIAPLLFRELSRLDTLTNSDERESAESDDTRENIMQALENIIARCPLYVSSMLPQSIEHAAKLLTWDPNYCDDMEGGDDDTPDEEEVEMEDDDDSSWKVRKSASRCLLTIVRSRSDALGALTKTLLQDNSLLVGRFNERVENVRLEILDLFRGLLTACRINPSSQAAANASNTTSGSTTHLGSFTVQGEEPLRSEARALEPLSDAIVKGLVRAAKHKSPKVKHSVFVILTDLFVVMGLQLSPSVGACVDAVVGNLSDPRLAMPHLRPTVLDFARVLVQVVFHAAQQKEDASLVAQLEKLLPSIIRCTEEKYFRTVVAALKVLQSFVPVVPETSNEARTAEAIFVPLYSRLSATDADQEVRRTAMEALAMLLQRSEKELATKRPSEVKQSIELIVSLLRNESTRIAAARAVGYLQKCNLDKAQVTSIATELTGFLRKTDRQVREQGLRTLPGFAASHQGKLDDATLAGIVAELTNPNVQLLSDSELFLTVLALQLAKAVVAVPSQAKNALDKLAPAIVKLLSSPLTQGAAAGEAASVLGVIARGSGDASKLFETLTAAAAAADSGALTNLSTAVGVVVEAERDEKKRASYVATCVKMAESPTPAQALAGVACLGDIGRFVKLSALGGVTVLEKNLARGSEDLKAAAATALGRTASSDAGADVLKSLVTAVQAGGADLILRLRALRDCFVTISAAGANAAPAALQAVSNDLFVALVRHASSDNESVVEAVSECIGRLAHAAPTVVGAVKDALPKLEEGPRAAVLSSVRFTMSHVATPQLDEAVRVNLPALLAYLNKSEGVRVRRAAVQLLTAAAYNRPSFIDNDTVRTQTFPQLLDATVVDKSLIEVIDLGPFKHTVDRGLDLRKQAFECLSVFADSVNRPRGILESTGRIDSVVTHLTSSLKEPETDFDCWASARNTLVKLARNPTGAAAIAAKADDLATNLKAMVSLKIKEGQEKDRVDDAVRGAIVCALRISTAVPTLLQNAKFADLLKTAETNPLYAKAKEALAE
jgi:cullin-associated NEDD8-dissociated protein 1